MGQSRTTLETFRTSRLIRWMATLVIAILFLLMINWLVKKMIYPAPFMGVAEPPGPLEEVRFPLSDGEEVFGWLYRAGSASETVPVVLFFHGNGENLETMRLSGMISDLQKLNVHFLAMDYPGYGKSDGSLSEAMLLEAADSAFVWVANHFFENPKVICGWSLGAAVAFQTAAKYASLADGLIALSPWTSLPDVASVHYPRFLVNLALREKYNSLEAARNIHCPALIIHGQEDQIIPIEQGEKLVREMPAAPRWVPVPEAGHNDLFDRPVVWREMERFLNEISGRQPQQSQGG